MADNYIERQREEYEKRKQKWLLKKRHKYVTTKKTINTNLSETT